eukprot:COSAG02_NODE_4746_length_5031_cov_4.410787_2_plen_71_part_00
MQECHTAAAWEVPWARCGHARECHRESREKSITLRGGKRASRCAEEVLIIGAKPVADVVVQTVQIHVPFP